MNEKQIIRAALKSAGMTQPELSELLGYKRETVGTLLRSKSDMGIGKLFRMMNAMGIDIVFRDREGKCGGAEWVLSEDESPIEAERYVDREEIERIKSEMKPPKR